MSEMKQGMNRIKEESYSFEEGNLSIKENVEHKLEVTLCGVDLEKEFLPPGWAFEMGNTHEVDDERKAIIIKKSREDLGTRVFSIFHEIGHVTNGGSEREAAYNLLNEYIQRKMEKTEGGSGASLPEVSVNYANRYVRDLKYIATVMEKNERCASVEAFKYLEAVARKSGKDPRVGMRDPKAVIDGAIGAYFSYHSSLKTRIPSLPEGRLPQKYIDELESHVSDIFERGKIEIKNAGELAFRVLSLEYDPKPSISNFWRRQRLK
jgi:hypothetical protein